MEAQGTSLGALSSQLCQVSNLCARAAAPTLPANRELPQGRTCSLPLQPVSQRHGHGPGWSRLCIEYQRLWEPGESPRAIFSLRDGKTEATDGGGAGKGPCSALSRLYICALIILTQVWGGGVRAAVLERGKLRLPLPGWLEPGGHSRPVF